MNIQFLSDLHLECAEFKPSQTDADVVVLAGDIAVGVEGVLWAKEVFDGPVIYVCGNHEYHDAFMTIDEHVGHLRQAASGSNVAVLDNDVAVVGGVRFIGTTMWTDLQGSYSALYCDIDRISVDASEYGPVHFSKEYQQDLFDRNKEWLKSELDKEFDGKTVVVTHHAPSWKSLHEQYVGNPWNPCFMTDLEGLMNGVDLWIHGHTHNSFDYELGDTRVVCNPRGYPNEIAGFENPEFDSAKIIEV